MPQPYAGESLDETRGVSVTTALTSATASRAPDWHSYVDPHVTAWLALGQRGHPLAFLDRGDLRPRP
jgi:hypothetical protein